MIEVQTYMLQEALGSLREPMEENIYRFVDLIIELSCG